MYVCMYVSIYLSMCVSMYLCIYVRMYVCMYVRVYVCMYACIYILPHIRAIQPCHPSHSMPLALILPRGDQ